MKKMEQTVVIFAGTTEGRILAQDAANLGLPCIVNTATEYGGSLLSENKGICVNSERMNQTKMREFFKQKNTALVIDATHPFAVEVTQNIQSACKEQGISYIRCLRKENDDVEFSQEGVVIVDSVKEAVLYLNKTDGNVLIATGSKELELYTELKNYKERCFARVLSVKESVDKAISLGFEGKHLIAMQGPFSMEMNLAVLRQIQGKYFVTKESGKTGGFEEKLLAAKEVNATLVIIGRPKEEGMELQEVRKQLEEYATDCVAKKTMIE
ncbi:MAG: precorrin-6A reductase [Candidatus Ruminococcus intestinipullorum]|nr:precorrin-6A reductase [Candidatus Ruminococcus intestinipullorum]